MRTEEEIKLRIKILKELVLSSNELDEKEFYRTRISLLEWVLEN